MRSEQWKWSSHFAKQVLRNGWKVLLAGSQWSRDTVYRQIAVNQTGIPPFDWASDHHAAAQRPGQLRSPRCSFHPHCASRGGSEPWRLSNDHQGSEKSIEVDRRSASTGRCTDATGIVNKMNRVGRLCFVYETNVFWNVCGQWDAETQRSILGHLIFDILGDDELPLLSSRNGLWCCGNW